MVGNSYDMINNNRVAMFSVRQFSSLVSCYKSYNILIRLQRFHLYFLVFSHRTRPSTHREPLVPVPQHDKNRRRTGQPPGSRVRQLQSLATHTQLPPRTHSPHHSSQHLSRHRHKTQSKSHKSSPSPYLHSCCRCCTCFDKRLRRQ